MTHIQEFPSSVVEKLEYYVYLLIDPEINQIFYIGKGVGNRIFAHVNGAIIDEIPSDKLDKIREIRAKGLEVKHIVHRHPFHSLHPTLYCPSPSATKTKIA